MSLTRLTIKMWQSAQALDGWLTVSFQTLQGHDFDTVAALIQRKGFEPLPVVLKVGDQCAFPWKEPRSHILIKLSGLTQPSYHFGVAEFDVYLEEGPMPTSVGTLTKEETAILLLFANAESLSVRELRESLSVVDVLERRKLRHRVDRLREAELVGGRNYSKREEDWRYCITARGIAYLIDSGLA